MERFFFLDDADRDLVAKRRGDHNRLGFALQLVTVRWLGTFLTDPLDVPLAVLDYVAAQVEVQDPSCVKRYTEREKTRLERQWEIAQVGGFVSFASAQEQLVEWLDRRAWTTGDGPKALFVAAVGWLRERRVLLPGVTGLRPEVLITDADSYSDVVFGIVTLLGFDYRPVLADLPDTKLWRIDAGADYGVLDKAARGRVDLAKIRRHWPDVLRVIASVHTREISAHDVIRVLQHDGRLTDLGEAVAYYGRIFKTLHVLTFADDPGYRRHLKGMRNLQEQRHGLGRHVFHGRKGELHQAYHAGMEDQLGALGLVLNCITLWNTLYLDYALNALRGQDYPVLDADAARLSAYQHKHINVHGHYSFALPDLGGTRRPRPRPRRRRRIAVPTWREYELTMTETPDRQVNIGHGEVVAVEAVAQGGPAHATTA